MHRHSTPPRPSRTSAVVGLGVGARRSSAAISIPGVHAPHWAPPQARNAAWSGDGPPAAGEALDGLDAPALDLARGDEAGADLLAVEPHRARAAVAGVAAHLRPGQAEVLAQDVDEAASAVGADLDARPLTSNRSAVSVTLATPVITPRPRRPRAGRASAPRPRGRRRCPGRRRSARGRRGARAAHDVPRRRVGRAARRARASSAAQPPRDRRARPDRDPRVGDAPSVDDEDGRRPRRSRSRGTRGSPSFTERRPRDGVRPGDPGPSAPAARDQLARPQVGPPVAEHESADRHDRARRRPTRARPRRRAPAGWASRRPPARRCTTFPHTVPAFWICRPPIVRAAAAQPVERRGQVASRRGRSTSSAPGSATRRRRRSRPAAPGAP